MAKTIMYTNRCYWVDWICVFNQQPSADDLTRIKPKMVSYLKNYLMGLKGKITKGIGGVSTTIYDEKKERWYRDKLTWGPQASKTNKKAKIIVTKNTWVNMLKVDWDRVSSKPLVFNFKAYFENNAKRYTLETKGTMTPPPPPPPPGTVPS